MPFFAHAIAFVVMLLLIGGVAVFDRSERQSLQNLERAKVTQELGAIRAALEGTVNSTLYLARGMIAYVSVHPDLDEAAFSAVAKELMKQRSHMVNITLVRNERIAFVYPVEGNEAARGINIFAHPVQGASAKRALASGQMVVGGPYELVQGGRAFISRAPIYFQKNGRRVYWGMASIPLAFDGIIADSGLLSSRNLSVAVRGEDGLGKEGAVFFGDGQLFDRPDAVKMSVSLPGGSWELAAVGRSGLEGMLWRSAAGVAAALGFAALFWSMLWLYYRQRNLTGQIQKREAAWQTLTENLNEAVFWTDEAGNLLYLSAQEGPFGLKNPQGQSWTALLLPAVRERATRMADAILHGESKGERSTFIAGQDRYVEVTLGPLRLESGAIGLVGTLSDITLRTQAQNQLDESRRELEESHKIARLGGWQIDLNTRLLTLSVEFRRLLEEDDPHGALTLPVDHFMGGHVHPGDIPTLKETFDRMLDGEKNPDYRDSFEYRLITHKGRVLNTWVHVRKRAGEPGVFVGVTQDITPLKEIQAALKISEARYRGFLGQLSDGVVITQNGVIRYANEAIGKMIGYDKSELIGTQVIDYVSDEDKPRLMEFHRRRMMGLPSPNEYEVAMVCKDGTVRTVRNNAAMTEWENEPAVIATVTDVSERKAYENLLLLQKKQHEELLVQQSKMAAMGEMIAAIIHQFKQPMSVISLILQELPEEAAAGELTSDRLQKLVEQALSQVEFMGKTADDFQNFFRPDKERSRFDPVWPVKEVEKLLARQLESAGIELRYDRNAATCEVRGVCNEFKQVMLNLLANAKDAILQASKNSGQPLAGGVIAIDFEATQHYVTLTVEDSGGGIPEALLERIFEPYFTTKGQGGTGVGLYMSRTIIESGFGGTITAENGKKGARFTLTLPCA